MGLLDQHGTEQLGRLGRKVGGVAGYIGAFSWVKDALSRPQDAPPKGFEFVTTADQAEMRPRTHDEIKQGTGAAAAATAAATLAGSKNLAGALGMGEGAALAAETYLENTQTPSNHYLTEDDLDRIRGDAPSLP